MYLVYITFYHLEKQKNKITNITEYNNHLNKKYSKLAQQN